MQPEITQEKIVPFISMEHDILTRELQLLNETLHPIYGEIISEPIYLSQYPSIPNHPRIKMQLIINYIGFNISICAEPLYTKTSEFIFNHEELIIENILNGTFSYCTEFTRTQKIIHEFVQKYNQYISSINRQDGFELAAELKKQQTPTVTPPHSQTGGATYQMPPGTQIFYTADGPTPDPIPCSAENTLTELTPPITVNVTINCHTSPSQSELDCLTNQIKTILNDAFKKSSF